jgi:hypothetical protein
MLRKQGPETIRPLWVLQLGHICRLESFRAPDDFELDGRTFLKATITVSLNRGKVDENVLATLPLDKTIPLAGIEPLNGSLLTIVTHVYFYSFFLVDSWRRPFCTSLPGLNNTNSRELRLAAFEYNSKGIQKRQTQCYCAIRQLFQQYSFYGPSPLVRGQRLPQAANRQGGKVIPPDRVPPVGWHGPPGDHARLEPVSVRCPRCGWGQL